MEKRSRNQLLCIFARSHNAHTVTHTPSKTSQLHRNTGRNPAQHRGPGQRRGPPDRTDPRQVVTERHRPGPPSEVSTNHKQLRGRGAVGAGGRPAQPPGNRRPAKLREHRAPLPTIISTAPLYFICLCNHNTTKIIFSSLRKQVARSCGLSLRQLEDVYVYVYLRTKASFWHHEGLKVILSYKALSRLS